MLLRFLLIIITTFHFVGLGAQRGINADNGARSLSLSGISSTLNNTDALFNNFSNLSDATSIALMASTQRRFELAELTTASFGVALPVQKIGVFGLTFSNYGFEEYSEQKITLAYARRLMDKVSLSVHFDYNNLRVSEFGSTSAFGFGLGLSGELSDNLSYGISIYNPEKIELVQNTELLTTIKFGLAYKTSKAVTIFTEVEKIIEEDINLIFGLEYLIQEKVFLRISSNTNPGAISFGIGYVFSKNLSIDGGFGYDTLLGTSPGLTLKYSKS